MASTAAAAKAPAAGADAPPPKKSKMMLIIILAVVLLAGGGGAAWFFLVKNKAAAEGEEEPVARPSNKPAVFVPIEQFVVNLQSEEGANQFLQTQMTLKVVDQTTADAIKSHMPEVRNRVLLLLSAKKPSQLVSREGKLKLAEQIAFEVDTAISPPKPKKKPKRKAKKAAEDEEAQADGAEGEDKPKKKAKAKPAEDEEEEREPSGLILDVLFTHFIIQ